MTEGPNRSTKLLMAAMKQVNQEWADTVPCPNVRRIAIKLCERDGRDPHYVVFNRPPSQLPIGAKGCAAVAANLVPQWSLYIDEAETFWQIYAEERALDHA